MDPITELTYNDEIVPVNNLLAQNIKKDITILGVTGSMEQAVPIQIDTSADMSALLVAENVGKVYQFVGTTDANYTNGDLYIVEEVAQN